MSEELHRPTNGWTVETLKYHVDSMRQADDRFNAERDRRYAEVANEREKALKIKETADRDALGLAREIQTYKDEKANELREQISSERGLYVRKDELAAVIEKLEATIKPITSYISSAQGRSQGISSYTTVILAVAIIVAGLVGHFIH